MRPLEVLEESVFKHTYPLCFSKLLPAPDEKILTLEEHQASACFTRFNARQSMWPVTPKIPSKTSALKVVIRVTLQLNMVWLRRKDFYVRQ